MPVLVDSNIPDADGNSDVYTASKFLYPASAPSPSH